MRRYSLAEVKASVQENDANRAGHIASKGYIFGEFSRYKLQAIHTRFGAVSWFVFDAESMDDCQSAIIRQEDTPEQAIAGLA